MEKSLDRSKYIHQSDDKYADDKVLDDLEKGHYQFSRKKIVPVGMTKFKRKKKCCVYYDYLCIRSSLRFAKCLVLALGIGTLTLALCDVEVNFMFICLAWLIGIVEILFLAIVGFLIIKWLYPEHTSFKSFIFNFFT